MIRRPPISTLFPNPPLFRSARDVEQVIDEPHQVLHLPLDDDAFSLESRLSAQPDELKRGEDGRKWISELVPEDGQELVLASVGFTGLVVQVCVEDGQAGVPP